jgi:hypothetical protein
VNDYETNEGSAVALVDQAGRALSGIRYSANTLRAALPRWIDEQSLDACYPHGFGEPLPPGAGTALGEVADLHQAALLPSTSDERQRVLVGLRSATIIQREDQAETDATMKLLRVHLEDVPLDILEAACRAYCNAPGKRFFPRSAGELREFIAPLLRARQRRAFRLRWLAQEAEAADAERARLAEVSVEPIEDEEIWRMTPALLQMAVGQGWLTREQISAAQLRKPAAPTQPAPEPTLGPRKPSYLDMADVAAETGMLLMAREAKAA